MATNAEEFIPGAVVRLKSGSPPMALISLHRDEQVAFCQWFDQAGQLKELTVPTASLIIVPEDEAAYQYNHDRQTEVMAHVQELMVDLNIALNQAGQLGLKAEVKVQHKEVAGGTGDVLIVKFSHISA